jgi:FkbM family methyltransferase
MNLLYLKHCLIRTPLEAPAVWLAGLSGVKQRLRAPELREIYAEGGRSRQVMRRLIRPDSNCIDIGCHLGSMLSHILRLAPKGKHMAFEPVPLKAQWLRKKFPEVDTMQMAAADKAGEVAFNLNTKDPGFSSLGSRSGDSEHLAKIVVHCDRLDAVVPKDRKIDFIKMDVEGAELLVLKGATDVIRRGNPSIMFESGPDDQNSMGLLREDVYKYFVSELGYSIFLMKDFLDGSEPLGLAQFENVGQYPFQAFNLLAIKRS